MRRTYKYRAYPTPAQSEALHGQGNEACRLYNAALDERRLAWRMHGVSAPAYADQTRRLPDPGSAIVLNCWCAGVAILSTVVLVATHVRLPRGAGLQPSHACLRFLHGIDRVALERKE